VRQTFINKEQEARVETQLKPINLSFAQMTTAVGVQAGHQFLNAPGDAPGTPFNGLFNPNSNRRRNPTCAAVASFLFIVLSLLSSGGVFGLS
jgi:hypothetical protein